MKANHLLRQANLEITIRENGGDRRRWGPFGDFSFTLPDLDGSWQIVVKSEGGYGRNKETGMTVIHNWKGNLREACRFLPGFVEAHYRNLEARAIALVEQGEREGISP